MSIVNTIKEYFANLPIDPNSKIHIKLKGQAICGARTRSHKLRFAGTAGEATCKRCLKAVEK